MNGPGMNRDGPPFHHMLRASGQSEVWHDMFQDAKLRQFGWRCTTSESAYHTGTLIGNWCEKRFDTGYTSKRRQPLSQVSDYYETTYSTGFNKDEKAIRMVQQREPRSFPGHQPELNPPHMNAIPKSCYGQDFTAERRECNTCAGESCDEPSSSRQENITATHDDQ
ncbi:UPF0686 protein C11orf1 homolog [Engraulis encrasicolus]|uniref:UPF0686 protein C11orf1 homolog n=1 Tax=Engraulis encrasicolus TaxID=184585 RepID=UPI002FD10323